MNPYILGTFSHLVFILELFNPELDERMRDLKTELESFGNDDSVESHKQKAVDALKRMESWNLFSDNTYEVYFHSYAFNIQ